MADTIMNSANSTAATEDSIILSIVQDELLDAAKLRGTVTEYMAPKGAKEIQVPKFSASFDGPQPQNPDGATTVDFQDIAFATDTISLDKWVNLPYRIPDRTSKQTVVAVEAEAARSAGKQMGIFIDDQIITELRLASTAAPDHLRALDGDATSGVGTALTLDGITTARMLLNKQNVPADERWFVIPPDQEKELLDLDQFRNADKYGSREALLDGEIGRIYGFRVMVHNRLAANECLAYHKSAVGLAVQQEVEFERQRADVRLKATDYSFALGMGVKVMDGGKRQVRLLGA